MHALLTGLLSQPAWLVYLVTGAVVFAEDAIFAGFLLPGETVALLGGVSVHLGHTQLGWMLLVVAAAAIAGDTVGYEVGRAVGPRLVTSPRLAKQAAKIDGADDLLRRRGGIAVFLGRWTAFLRAVMPALAGSSRMPYARFVAWNVAGGLTWATTVVLVGDLAGAGYQRVATDMGRGVALAIGLIAVGALVMRHRSQTAHGRRRRPGD